MLLSDRWLQGTMRGINVWKCCWVVAQHWLLLVPEVHVWEGPQHLHSAPNRWFAHAWYPADWYKLLSWLEWLRGKLLPGKMIIYIQGRFQDFQIEGVQLKFIF